MEFGYVPTYSGRFPIGISSSASREFDGGSFPIILTPNLSYSLRVATKQYNRYFPKGHESAIHQSSRNNPFAFCRLVGKLGFFHEAKQRYEDFLELGESQLPLMADSEFDSWCFLFMARMVSFMAFARLSRSSNFASFPLISESPRQGWRRRTA